MSLKLIKSVSGDFYIIAGITFWNNKFNSPGMFARDEMEVLRDITILS